MQVYNPPQDLMNDIKAGFVQDDNDLLESYLVRGSHLH